MKCSSIECVKIVQTRTHTHHIQTAPALSITLNQENMMSKKTFLELYLTLKKSITQYALTHWHGYSHESFAAHFVTGKSKLNLN